MTDADADQGALKWRLAQLIQDAIDRGSSLRDIEARAFRKGHEISYGTVRDYRLGTKRKMPSDAMIAALAAGLELPETVVLRAAFLDWYGYDPTNGAPIQIPENLSADKLRQLEEYARFLAASGE